MFLVQFFAGKIKINITKFNNKRSNDSVAPLICNYS